MEQGCVPDLHDWTTMALKDAEEFESECSLEASTVCCLVIYQ
jgi:hypothetical protein